MKELVTNINIKRKRESELGFFQETLKKEKKARAQNDKLNEFLNYVVQGEQDKAEELLKEDHTLALRQGPVTDFSQRKFEGITGFQYAVWALDWHMWRMLLNYMPREAARLQLVELEEKGTGHGKSFDLSPLITALQTYDRDFGDLERRSLGIDPAKKTRAQHHWGEIVGKHQSLLPAHVVQEYSHTARSFRPCPEFKEETRPPSDMVRCWYEWIGDDSDWKGGSWVRSGSDLLFIKMFVGGGEYTLTADIEALQSLQNTRRLQLEELKAEFYAMERAKEALNQHLPPPLVSTMLDYFCVLTR